MGRKGVVGIERRGLQKVLIGRMTRFQGNRVNSVFLEGIQQMSMVLRILCTFCICLGLSNTISMLLFAQTGPKRTFSHVAAIFHLSRDHLLLIRLLPKRELFTLFLQMSASKKACVWKEVIFDLF